jgi:hypothetical protein
MELEQPIKTTLKIKCRHIKCNRSAYPEENGYCEDCIQLDHLKFCNYCSEILRREVN